jgi:hypothetical protein
MYCPVCLNDTLKIRSSGVVKLSFDGLAKNTSQFTYNLKQDNNKLLKFKLREKVEEFCKWYSLFQNKSPLKKIEVFSADFECENNCAIDVQNRMSVIGQIYFAEEVIKIVKEEAAKYDIPVEATEKDF